MRFIFFFRALTGRVVYNRNRYNLSGMKRILITPFWWLLSILISILDLVYFDFLILLFIRIVEGKSSAIPKHIEALHPSIEGKLFCYPNSKIARWSMRILGRKSLGLGIRNCVLFSREINWKSSKDVHWFLHEYAHVLQWRGRGLIYIPEALFAQWNSGYTFTKEAAESAENLKYFNPEQQACIYADYLIGNHLELLKQDPISW